jgi:hypothetical protein
MRSFGHSVQSAQQNVSLNFEITYKECEDVFSLMKNTQEIAIEIERINNQWIEINNIIGRLVGEINAANS